MANPSDTPQLTPLTKSSESILVETLSTSAVYFRTTPGNHLTPSAQSFFEQYAGIPKVDVVPHITEIRNRAWKIRPYPCVGSFAFLDFPMQRLPAYEHILKRLVSEPRTFVDLGCCFGQDLRWLMQDGVPPSSMIGIDLLPDFWELGKDLFRDAHSIKDAKLITGDVFDENNQELNDLTGKVDVLFAANFFHLFGWNEQLYALRRVVEWSKGPGAIICGEMIGMIEAKEKLSGWGKNGATLHFWHDEMSWRRLWVDIEIKTQTNWDVWTEAVKTSDLGDEYQYMGNTTIKLKFVCERKL